MLFRSVGAKVQVVIDEQGKVIQAKLIEGHETFGAAAVKSALNATFPRSMIAGKPVKVRGVLEFKQHPNNDVRFETKGSSGMTLPLFLAGSDSSYGSILR